MILVDVNLSAAWIDAIQHAGFHAVHWPSLGPGNALDQHIMEYALLHDYYILTRDLDFGEMLSKTGALKPSVIQLRMADVRPEAAASRVILAITQNIESIDRGCLIIVQTNRIRTRALPLV